MTEHVIPLDQLADAGNDLYDYDHARANAIIRSTMAIASLISSSVLIWMINRSSARLSTTNNRILLGMSIADILASMSMANFNLTAPKDLDYIVWNAIGNQTTCDIQGTMWFVGVTSALMYNCSLNLYFLAVVKYNMRDEHIRAKIEPFLHGIPIIIPLISGLIITLNKNANAVDGGLCTALVYRPLHCIGYEDGEIREGFVIPCGRGADGVSGFAHVMYFISVIITPLTVGTSLAMIYRFVSQQERRMAGYGAGTITASTRPSNASNADVKGGIDDDADGRVVRSSQTERLSSSMSSAVAAFARAMNSASGSNREQSNSNSKKVLQRAIAYSIAYFLTITFFLVGICLSLAGMKWPFSIWYLASIFTPLQGCFNFLIYIYPKVKKAKSGAENVTWYQAFAGAIAS